MILAEGKEDGIEYKAELKGSIINILVGKEMNSFNCSFTPICGVDIADIAETERILEEMITNIKNKVR